MRTYKGLIKAKNDMTVTGIFVFGSNTEGRHGKGAALTAVEKFGANYGQAIGRQGQSYAIVTKDLRKKEHPSISKEIIMFQIDALYNYARRWSGHDYYIAYSGEGTNLNAYSPREMAEMFASSPIPENMVFEENFAELIKQYL